MTPKLWKIAGTLALLGIIAAGTVFGVNSCRRRQASEAETQAYIASGEAGVHQSNATTSDTTVSDLKAKLADQTVILARVAGERDALLKRWNARSLPLPALPSTTTDDRPALLEQLALASAVIEKDAAMIEDQSKVIETQALTIGTVTVSRDEWKATAEARERQARAQEVATKAWKQSVTSSKWVGRFQGFAAGVAVGYVAGARR